MSGGGHRAALVAVGAMRHLAAGGLLRNVRHVTSVSGGSVANALLGSAWRELRNESFRIEAFDELVTHPLLALVSDRSLARELAVRSWRSLLPTLSRTSLLADRLDTHLFDGARLEDLPEGCWFEINAANLTTGARFRFTRDLVGDYISGSAPTTGSGVRLGDC
ncbi:MAG: hypothetical protein GY798_09325 [Hyphomicrobiales bacterium]|nr:hypothetical protein [Hyphomicrobiales bacterium]